MKLSIFQRFCKRVSELLINDLRTKHGLGQELFFIRIPLEHGMILPKISYKDKK